MPTALGQALARARGGKDWSLREVEKRTGIQNAHLAQIENGTIARPSPTILMTLADLYGLEWDELMRLAGHLQTAPRSPTAVALRALKGLSPEQQAEALRYLKELARRR